jgi:uncharacterized membrane protein
MKSPEYNTIAGQSVERLAALSDGIFGVAMTLLLLEVRPPARDVIHSDLGLARELLAMYPQLLVYLMSFITLGIFWVGQQTQLNYLERSDRHLTWIHLGFLFAVTILPFSTELLTTFIKFRTALITYWLNISLLGALLYACWARATRASLVKSEIPLEIRAAVCNRIIVAQSLYAVGAMLCIISTFVSIVFIVLVQLNYAIAPRTWFGKFDNEP